MTSLTGLHTTINRTFLTARAVTTPLAKLAESKLSAEAALGLKKLKTKTAVANLNKLGLRLTPGATLAKLLSEAEKGSNSANAALKKAVDEAAEHMVFSETGDEVIRKIVFDQYRHNGGIKPISRTSRLWNSIKGWCVLTFFASP